MAKEKHYIRSDGNGGYNISKSVIGFGTLLVILGMVIPAIAYVTTMNGKITQLEDVWRDVRTEHPIYVETTEKRMDLMEKDHMVFKTEVKMIFEDIREIKTAVKEIKNGVNGGLP